MRISPASLVVIRERSGLTQSDLARKSKVSQGRISELENASEPLAVRPANAVALAKALAVPLAAIVVHEEQAA